MDQETFIQEISSLPGVGRRTAEKLYEAGFHTIDAVRGASEDKLAEAVGARYGKAILAGLAGPKEPVTVVEAKPEPKPGKAPKAKAEPKEEPKAEVVEAGVYVPKIRPTLSGTLKRALKVRAAVAAARPRFMRVEFYRHKELKDVWRSPRGKMSKQRREYKGNPAQPHVGYRGPRMARGLHPSGFREVMVHTPAEVAAIDAATQAVRIGATVGKRKRRLIVEAAAERGIRVLNPGVSA